MENKPTNAKKTANASKNNNAKRVAKAKTSSREENIPKKKVTHPESNATKEHTSHPKEEAKENVLHNDKRIKESSTEKKEVVKKTEEKKEKVVEKENSSIIWKLLVGVIVIAIIIFLLIRACSKKEYEVTFDTQGGSVISSLKVKENGTIEKPKNPTKEGYIFEGWYYEDKKFDFNTKISDDIQLVAKWSKVENIQLTEKEISILLNKNKKIEIETLPESVNKEDLVWSSSNDKIVTVDENGNVKALQSGTVTITVKTKDGTYSATCKVKVVVEEVSVTGVSIQGSNTVVQGNTITLKVVVTPDDATNQKVTWSSSDKKIATVDGNGKVKALQPGTVTITVTTDDGKKTATKKITVQERKTTTETNQKIPVVSVSISGGNRTIKVGDTLNLKAVIKPSNATNQKVVWSSSNPARVSVDANGKIKGLKAGTSRITVTTEDGRKIASIIVTVESSYSITFTALKDALGNISQYEISVTKDGKKFEDYKTITYNGNTRPFKQSNNVDVKFINTKVKTATIHLTDGTDIKVTDIVYKTKNIE